MSEDAPAVAEIHGAQTSGVALVDPKDGSVIRILETFGAAAQATGSYNGHYAVWKEAGDPTNVADFTVKEWNAATGVITTVGGAHKAPNGQTIQSTVQDPVIAGDYAAWVEGSNDDGSGEIVVLDLATGKRSIVHRGHPGWLTLTDDSLIWAESPKPEADTTIRAIDPKTGKTMPPPAVLANIRGAWGFITDGTAWAWIDGDSNTLYGASTDNAEPVKIGVVPKGGASPPLAVAGGVVIVPVSVGGVMIANIAASAWTYDPKASYATSGSGEFFVVKEATSKSLTDGTPIAVVSSGSAAELSCTE